MRRMVLAVVFLALTLVAAPLPAAPGDSLLRQVPFTCRVDLAYPKNYRFQFTLWTGSESDPLATRVWSEAKVIALRDPLLSTRLGSHVPLEGIDFSQQLWVQAQVWSPLGSSWRDLGRRRSFAMVPYALFSIDAGTAGSVPPLADGSVTAAQLADASVTAAKLADGSVTTAKLGDASVTAARLGDGSVTAAKLADGASIIEIRDDDGSASGLDADLLDGRHASDFAVSSHTHDERYYTKNFVDDLERRIAALETPGAGRAPTADAGPDQGVKAGATVSLDGRGSWDPDGDPLTYSWAFSARPAGSTAVLSDALSPTPTFVADLEGTFVVSLVVSDGTLAGAPDAVNVVAAPANTRPIANAGADQVVVAGVAAVVMLDGSLSFDPEGTALSYAWTLLAKPTGSAAALSDGKAAQPTFLADLEGTYVFALSVNDGVFESLVPDSVTVTAHRRIARLPMNVSDAEYSPQLDRIVIVSTMPLNQLHVYDPVTEQVRSVTLNLAPTCVSVGPDGRSAVVGHNGYLSHVDLATPALLATIPVSADVFDVVLAGNGFAYAFPRIDQWETIRCIDLATGLETQSTGYSIYAGTRAKLHPGGTAIYGADNGLSPSDIEKYDISLGTAAMLYDSPYHGDYSMCGNLWISEDGFRIFTRCGYVFRSSPIRSEDMTYNGALEGIGSVAFVSHSLEAGKVVAIPANGYGQTTRDREVQLFNYEYLTFSERRSLPYFVQGAAAYPGQGRYAFFSSDGSTYYVIVQAAGASGWLYDCGVVTY